MKRISIFAVLLIISGCGGGSAEAPLQTSPTPPVAQAPTISPKVVFVGDSIIAHWQELSTLVPDSVNAGVGGETTAQMLARFDTALLAHHPTVVVIEGGVNDLVSMENPNADNIARMAEMASASGARVVILSVMPADIPYAIWRFNSDIQRVTNAFGYNYVDLFYPMSVQPDYAYNPALFNSDGVHPNAKGYEVMWNALKPVLQSNNAIQ